MILNVYDLLMCILAVIIPLAFIVIYIKKLRGKTTVRGFVFLEFISILLFALAYLLLRIDVFVIFLYTGMSLFCPDVAEYLWICFAVESVLYLVVTAGTLFVTQAIWIIVLIIFVVWLIMRYVFKKSFQLPLNLIYIGIGFIAMEILMLVLLVPVKNNIF